MIHQNDDYKTLIELLYPSIEASGNVYYGQTRKLIMDEILDKNDLGFESHIDSIRVKDSSADYGFIYKKYFYWKLGPWSDSFEYEEDIDYGVYYGKYKLNIENKKIDEELHSGSFSSYEKDIIPEFNGIALTGGDDPTEKEEYDGRNFYILKEDNNYYLYIAVPQSKNQCSKPLTLTAVGGSTKIRIVAYVNENEQVPITDDNKWYEYKKNNGSWTGYDGSFIELENGDNVSLRSTEFRPTQFSYDLYSVIEYDSSNTDNTKIEATGSISSMSAITGDFKYNYYNLFHGFNILTRAPKISGKIAYDSEYCQTFDGCTSLVNVPDELPAMSLNESCYQGMFYGCVSLIKAPYLPATDLPDLCYSQMFMSCSSLSYIKCNVKIADNSSFDDWVEDVSEDGIFYCNEEFALELPIDDTAGIPVGWKVRDINNTHATCMMYCKYDTAGPVIRYGHDFASYIKDGKVIKFTPSKTVDLGEGGEIHDIEFVGFDNENVLDENDILPGNIHFSGSLTNYLIDSYNETITSGAVINRNKYDHGIMITSGSNSDSNGRGDITTQSTLSNMEKSFDENNNHPMNTYNADGSYNQEIWGYKVFNSPVQFRNGIYGENFSITSTYNDTDDGYNRKLIFSCNSANGIVESSDIDTSNLTFTHEYYPQHGAVNKAYIGIGNSYDSHAYIVAENSLPGYNSITIECNSNVAVATSAKIQIDSDKINVYFSSPEPVFSANSSGVVIKELTSVGNIIPSTSNATIGNADHAYKDIYATNIHGKLYTDVNQSSSNYYLGVGDITLITIRRKTPLPQNTGMVVFELGSIYLTSDTNYEILPCNLLFSQNNGTLQHGPDNIYGTQNHFEDNYKFKLLSGGAIISGDLTDQGVIVLAMRIE
jgi:hypothetical protein